MKNIIKVLLLAFTIIGCSEEKLDDYNTVGTKDINQISSTDFNALEIEKVELINNLYLKIEALTEEREKSDYSKQLKIDAEIEKIKSNIDAIINLE